MRRRILQKPRFWLVRMLCGSGLLLVFLYSVVTLLTFKSEAIQVQGQVLSVQKESHATGRRGGRITIERPVVRFVVPGSAQEVTATAKVLTSRSFHEGDTVDLEFLPTEPAASVRVAGGLSLLEVAFGVVGAVILFFGFGEKWRYLRESRQQTTLTLA